VLRPLQDRDRLQSLYATEPLKTVRARNILYGLRSNNVRILVDDVVRPCGALVSQDGLLWDLYSPDLNVAKAMLDAFDPGMSRAILVGLAEHLVDHVRSRFTVITCTPTDLYVLADPADVRGLGPTQEGLAELAPEHAELVAKTWPHDDFDEPSHKVAYIRSCIELEPGVAKLQGDRPVSFALVHSDGSMGFLHTDAALRGRGLARVVVSALIRKLIACNAPVFGFVAVGNKPSASLIESLGLRAVQRGAWMTIQRRM
jgi:hypothetical protein